MPTTLRQATLAALELRPSTAAARFDRPAADEHHPYYSAYIDRVPPGNLLDVLREQAAEVGDFFGALSPTQARFAYAPGKWTVQEVLGHLVDTERVFVYRAMSIAREDPAELPGYSQDEWMAPADFARRELAGLVAEWLVVRAATVVLAEGLPADAPLRRGIASGRPFSVRALLYVPPGHVVHHLGLLRERYRRARDWPA